jgi:acetyl-CoA C-acetyltransferase
MSTSFDPIVIVGSARTPLGSFQGALSSLTAPELGATSIRAAVDRAGLKLEEVQEEIMGCVLPAGLGQAPARQATLGGHPPKHRLHHGQQDVRLGHESRHARP